MGIGYNPKIVTDGLILCLDAANSKSFPKTGTTWNDLSNNGNTGTLINGSEPVKQNSIVFDGSGDFLTFTNLSATYLSNNFCIESWVYLTSQSNQMFFNTIPHTSFGISLNRGGSGQTALYIGNGSSWQTLDFRSSSGLVANQWHHIAVTRNSNVITIWHNGVNQGSTSAVMPTGFGTSAYVGTYNGGTGENINGKIYGYRIVSGSPVYTENFTPPTRVTNISGTQLIVGQDGGFVNSAQTSVVATPSGNTYVNDQSYIKFDGVNDTTTVPTILSAYPFSVSMWVTNSLNWVAGSGTMDELFNMSISGQRVSMGIVNVSTWPGVITLMYGGTHHWTCPGPTDTGSNDWHNITWVVYGSNNSSHKIYLDGVSQTLTNNGGGHGGTAGWNIGSNSANGEHWPGKISNVLVYPRVLTASEVAQNFQATRGRYGI